MKVFKNRVLAVLMAVCMMLSLLPISALAANDFDLSIKVKGEGVTWYAEDKAGTEIGDGSYAVPAGEVEVDDEADVPTITVTTVLYVKADPGYALTELEKLNVNSDKDAEKNTTFDIDVTDKDLKYCDLKVTLKFNGYAVEGKSASVTLTIDAEPLCDLSIDVGGTGVTWYAEDKAGTEIGDGSYAVPSGEIEVNKDAITVTVTLYVKAEPGYEIGELDDFDVGLDDKPVDEGDLPTSLGIDITNKDLKYCDLKVTLKFDKYVMEGNSTSVALRIDAEPTYLAITAGGTKLAIDKFSTESYAKAEAIPYGVAYNAEGTTVAVSATVDNAKDGVLIGRVVNDKPEFDEETHTGATLFADVTPENTIDNPVYVAVKYVPDKKGAEEARPYDEFFKIALYMKPAVTSAFTDVPTSEYFFDPVTWAVEKGVTTGTGDGTTFSPTDICSRAQFATFLYRAAGKPAVTGIENKFTDVSETAHASYYAAILWAVDQGITTGTGDGTTFSPTDPITRAQAVTLMYRYAQKAGIAGKSGIANFSDVANEGALAVYYDAIGWAVANGISTGYPDGTFAPTANCQRAEMVTFLYRLFNDAA